MQTRKETITLTFGDYAENHAGMEKIGKGDAKPITVKELKEFKKYFEEKGLVCEYRDLCDEAEFTGHAAVLVIKNCIDFALRKKGKNADDLFAEQKALEWDTKAFMRGRVVNKHARHNLCYADFSQNADFEEKKGAIVNLNEIPLTRKLKKFLQKVTSRELVGEGNRYYDVSNCGIGYHGDTERKVVGCRLGAEMPLHFQWFHRSMPVGKNMKIVLQHGDVYFMSKRAVGYDWKSSSKYTLRHAAGCKKFVSLERFEKKKK